jgi:outer membrane immunogenic protein
LEDYVRKNIGLALASVISLGVAGLGAASAADMAVKARPMPPPVVQVYSWTGFYIGLNAGGAWGRSDVNAFTEANFLFQVPFLNAAGTRSFRPTGFIGGGQFGYNWQAGNFVLGIEADAQFQDLSASSVVNPVIPGTGGIMTQSVKSDFLATVRPRVGVAFGSALFYATGGLAVGTVKNFDALTGVPPITESAFTSSTRVGWTAGGGVEWGFTPNWSVKAEYLYVDLGTSSHRTPDFPGFTLTGIVFNSHFTEQVARVGINYRWGGSPVVARY